MSARRFAPSLKVSNGVTSPLIDAESQTVRRPTTAEGPSQQRLSARGADSVREECVGDDGTAREWGSCVKAFEDYLMTEHAASQTWEDEKGVRPTSHRFTPEYAVEKTGKIYGGLRYIRDQTPDTLDVQTVMVTRTGWPFDGDGRPAPPVEFLDGLIRGRKKFVRELRRTLDESDDVTQWGRVSVREPHDGRRSGYPHAHDGIVVVTTLDPSETTSLIRPIVDGYVDANPFARPCDHEEGSLTVMSRNGDESDVAESLGAELTNNLVGYEFDGPNPLDGVDESVRRFSSLMWATGKQTVTPDKSFKRWMSRSQDGWTPDDGEREADDSEPMATPTGETADGPEYVEPKNADVSYQFPDDE